jgi:hypothetical protein
MLFGNRRKLGFEIRPLSPSWEQRYVSEQTAWVTLTIWVREINLCRHIMPGSDRVLEALNVPLVPMADWLCRAWPALQYEEQAPELRTATAAHRALGAWADTHPPARISEDEWLDARERWWSRHFLAAGADGAQLPNVAFVRQDDQLVIDWAPPRFAGYEPPLLLSSTGQESVPWADAREAFHGLVAQVAAWLQAAGLTAHFPWAHSPDPLAKQAGTLVERLSLFTGRPHEMLLEIAGASTDQELLTWLRLPSDAQDPGASPIPQALRDLSRRTPPALAEALSDLGARTSSLASTPPSGWLAARSIALDAAQAALTPEEAGQLAADAMREAWELDGQPIADLDAQLRALEIEIAEPGIPATHERMLTGAREDGRAVALLLDTPRTKRRWGRRFELARALGHLLQDPLREGALGAASGPFSQETRRRRSGAFAAELLLPESALAAASGGALDGAAEPAAFEALLSRYGVGARTAANQLWNRRWLSSEALRDDLIERYGALPEE